MIVFRLCRREYKNDLSGEGARIYGGRWNSKGISMLYAGETRALCSTEIAVHAPYGIIPHDYFMVSVNIPDNCSIKEISLQELPSEWNHFPHQEDTQKTGDDFIQKAKHLVLKVPSATIQGEHNFLINPMHPEMKKVTIIQTEPFTFDQRLFIR